MYDSTTQKEAEDLDQLWLKVDEILDLSDDDLAQGPSIDPSLIYTKVQSFVAFCTNHYESHLQQATAGEDAIAKLVESSLFTHSSIMDIAEVLIKLVVAATSLPALHLLFQALLLVGKHQPEMYRSTMVATQLIPRLVHHIWAARYAEEHLVKDLAESLKGGEGNGEAEGWIEDWNVKYVRAKSMGDADKAIEEARNRILQCRLREESVVLLYQVCRAQRLELKDMRAIDGAFIDHLFELVEASRHFNDDSYNYRLIKLIVALNEQFMVAGIESTSQKTKTHSRKSSATSSNIVMSVLRYRLHASNTFGENLIWMLNRASNRDAEDICMQLLVLKLLYLLFTTKETAHYFYLNDLKVLVDVFIRELSDLPEESESLRNTYLRVLHPLLTNTQLLTLPYKRDAIRSLLQRLISHANLRDISSTTKRLVDRCLKAQWCVDLDVDQNGASVHPKQSNGKERKHTLEIQTIAGGPKTIVQTQTITNAEGVHIPVTSKNERYQGVPSTTRSTMEVAAATHLPSETNGFEDSAAMLTSSPIEQEHHLKRRQSRTRGSSVGAVSPRPSDQALSNGNGIKGETGKENGEMSKRDASTLSVRRDLGQRSVSAMAAPFSSPHEILHRRSQEVDTDEENISRWSEGSGSNSWHMVMAGEDSPNASSLSQSNRDCTVRHGSPLIMDSTEHYSPLVGAGEVDETKAKNLPVLQIETIINEEDATSVGGTPSMSSSTGSLGQGRRRRPPAPPSSDGGHANRRDRRLQYASSTSTSETNLHASLANSLTGESQPAKNNTSLPNSPQAESINSSRADSPILDPSCPYIPASEYIPQSRRKPPPPPVNRATKGKLSSIPRQARTHSTSSSIRHEGDNGQQSYYNQDTPADARQVERALDYLYVSEDGYGW